MSLWDGYSYVVEALISAESKKRVYCHDGEEDELSRGETPKKNCTPAMSIKGSPASSFDECAQASILECSSPPPSGAHAPLTPTIAAGHHSPPPRISLAAERQHGDVPELYKGRMPASLSMQSLMAGINELPQGPRHTLAKCIVSWREGNLPESQVLSFLRSVAWQSATLRDTFADQDEELEEQSLISPFDLHFLFNSPPQENISPLIRPSIPTASPQSPASLSCGPPGGPEENVADEGTCSASGGTSEICMTSKHDVDKALAIVCDQSILDSSKTHRLALLMSRCKDLQKYFVGNEWDAASCAFRGMPDWGTAKASLATHLAMDDGSMMAPCPDADAIAGNECVGSPP